MLAPADHPATSSRLGLGLDVGGTETRWALADPDGSLIAEGAMPGFSGLDLQRPEGEVQVADLLTALAASLPHGARPVRLVAGVTGMGEPEGPVAVRLRGLLARALQLDADVIRLFSDIELAYRSVFGPGEGYLVYAGTGSIAAFVDEAGIFHRAGGYGGLLDDAGSGYWIAREALRQIWRTEDEEPGAWQRSMLAQALFARIGGSDWSSSRAFVYGANRGEIGKLALAVAEAGDADPLAHDILWSAGAELARLAGALIHRFGPRPVVLSGRAAGLHPVIETAMRECLPANVALQRSTLAAHHAAARLAVQAR
ncbi:N-acetylglucosamine kinase [Chitinimonas sp. BJYL2]|uniref:N-acetylglucosamine kinase n=1 Tax=Chitinimonas sp. BJYL2 TaxID=2976696 RepID=UPI0022B42862|nr:BadF/BadG/BcrA/BcrD ATPase family protein [Chitinimonas sp. BJYL2]